MIHILEPEPAARADLIKTGGEWISSQDMENMICDMAGYVSYLKELSEDWDLNMYQVYYPPSRYKKAPLLCTLFWSPPQAILGWGGGGVLNFNTPDSYVHYAILKGIRTIAGLSFFYLKKTHRFLRFRRPPSSDFDMR